MQGGQGKPDTSFEDTGNIFLSREKPPLTRNPFGMANFTPHNAGRWYKTRTEVTARVGLQTSRQTAETSQKRGRTHFNDPATGHPPHLSKV